MVDLRERNTPIRSFAGKQTLWDLGDLIVADVHTGGIEFTSGPMQTRKLGVDHWCLTLFLDGACRTVSGDDIYDSSLRLVQAHPLGLPFHGYATDSHLIMVLMSRDYCNDTAHILDSIAFQSICGPFGQLLSSYITCLLAQLPYISVSDTGALAHATRDMVLACAAPSAERIAAVRDQFTTTVIERARKFVMKNLYNLALDPDLLTREMGMSRTKLYNLFEPAGGIHRYIKRQRLCEAHRRLVDAQNPCRIQDLAERLGFSDGADFSRAFKREFSYTPSDARHHLTQATHLDRQGFESLLPHQRLPFLLRRLEF